MHILSILQEGYWTGWIFLFLASEVTTAITRKVVVMGNSYDVEVENLAGERRRRNVRDLQFSHLPASWQANPYIYSRHRDS